jgi:imidazolonepropionase
MTPNEALNAATINGAYAMNLNEEIGSITKGKLGNFFITKEIPSYNVIPYNFGNNQIQSVYIKGKKVSN